MELITKEEKEALSDVIIINKIADEITNSIAEELKLNEEEKELIKLLIKIIILFILKMRKDNRHKPKH